LKCLTWNIRLGLQQGLQPIIDVLRSEDPDLISLQEVGRNWTRGPEGDSTAIIADALGYYSVFSPSIVIDGHEYGHALLSRWPIAHADVVALPEDTDEPRTLLISEITHPLRSMRIFSTHLSHVEDRAIQVPFLLQQVWEKQPDVVMGDLNSHEELWLDSLRARLNMAEQWELTFPTPAPTMRLDYLFGQGQWSEVARLDTNDISDHYPVKGTLTFS
jgi:endonuclease/exonuclease/phosphatase family metal-dependent hydrolase